LLNSVTRESYRLDGRHRPRLWGGRRFRGRRNREGRIRRRVRRSGRAAERARRLWDHAVSFPLRERWS